MLQAHILDFYGDKGAVFQGLLQRRTGVIGMHMDLDDLIIVHQHQTVAQFGQERTQLLRVLVVLPGDDELRAVGKGDVLVGKVGEIGALLHLGALTVFGDHHILAPEGQQHGFQHEAPALAAGVHHAGLFQHRVLVHGIGQSNFCRFQRLLLDEFQVVVLVGGGQGLGGGQPGHGQDGALSGLHHGLVGGVHAFLQSIGPQHAVTFAGALELLGNAPHQQGKNHAGVAPGAPQHGGGGSGSGLLQRGGLQLPQVGSGGVNGHRHIGTGISVRHREHIQLIELLFVDLNGCGSAQQHSAEIGSVYGLPQWFTPPKIIQSSWNQYRHSRPVLRCRYIW